MCHLLFTEPGITMPIPITAIGLGIIVQVSYMAAVLNGTTVMGIAIQWVGTDEYLMAL